MQRLYEIDPGYGEYIKLKTWKDMVRVDIVITNTTPMVISRKKKQNY